MSNNPTPNYPQAEQIPAATSEAATPRPTTTPQGRDPLGAARDRAFGPNPVMGPDGEPLEKGVGSKWASMSPHAKAHYHALQANEGADVVVSLAKQLADAAARLGTALKVAIGSADAAAKAPRLAAEPSDELIAKIKSDGVNEYKAKVAKDLADQAERDKQGKIRIEAAEKAEKERIALRTEDAARAKADADLGARNPSLGEAQRDAERIERDRVAANTPNPHL